jgi:sulfur relay protein TusB/DsrH|tara:strand:- start:135 stop:416 length:282 start_codon:yes stop_codon:yes gene_type:complete
MALHIIKSAKADTLLQAAELASSEDQILLLEDGCYLYSIAQQSFAELQHPIQALADHMQARGLSKKASDLGIELISLKQWVLLTHRHPQSTTW